MAIYSRRSGGDFNPAPEGQHQAVCVDVVDKGLRQTNWGTKLKVQLRWQIDQIDEKADPPRRFLVVADYTNSMDSRSDLFKHLELWRGREFTEEELEGPDGRGFDIESVIGANCMLFLTHKKQRNGQMFAKISAIVKLRSDVTKIRASDDYVRMKDREDYAPPPSEPEEKQQPDGNSAPANDDDIPF